MFQHLSFQQMLPSTSCACSFGKETSSVSVGAALCFIFDHTEERELEGRGLIWNWVVALEGSNWKGDPSFIHKILFETYGEN